MLTHWRSMYVLFIDLLRYDPSHLIATLLLMMFRSISAGAGLLLIIPLLQVIGFSIGHEKTNGITQIIIMVMQYLHLPLSLLSILACYISVVSIIAFSTYQEQKISTKLQQGYIHHLRARLYMKLLHSKWSFFIKQKRAHLLMCLTSQIQTLSAANFNLLTLLSQLILMSVYTILALILSWQMTLIAGSCALLLLSLMLPLHRLTSQSGQTQLLKNQTIAQSISEQLGALKMIKGSGFEQQFVKKTFDISLSLEQQNQRLTQIMAATKLLYSCGGVTIFSVLLYLALHVFSMALSSLLLLLVIFSRLLPMVSTIQQSYQRFLHQLPTCADVKNLLQQCIAHQEQVHDDELMAPIFHDEINLTNISFRYQTPGSQYIIQHLSLCIKKNTTTAIIGPSGVGKSTLADLIVGLLEPTEGTIAIDQQVLNTEQKLAWRKSVAYVTQDCFLFHDSIRHNLQLFCEDCSDETLWAALNMACADHFVAKLEHGLDTIIGDCGVRLSGGECQRIALARALLLKPQLLVLDESTSSLDKETIATIQQSLLNIKGKMTILIISHQEEMSRFADQEIILEPKNDRYKKKVFDLLAHDV